MILTKPTKTHTFTNGTVAQAPQVNTNFTDIFGVLEEDAYLAKGWFLVDDASFEYHASNAIKTTADVDLTSILQEGDKMTFEQATDGEYFAFVTKVDYNATVANRTYVELFVYEQNAVEDEAITADSLGISRARNPWGFPLDKAGWTIEDVFGSSHSVTSTTFTEFNSARRLLVPVGLFTVGYQGPMSIVATATTTQIGGWLDLSESSTAQTADKRLTAYMAVFNGGASANDWVYTQHNSASITKKYNSPTTLYWIGKRQTSTSQVFLGSVNAETAFTTYATIAYL